MIHRLLREQLDKVAARYRSLRFWQTLAVVWLLAAAAGGVWAWQLRGSLSASSAVLALSGLAFVLAAAACWLAARSARNPVWIARQVESAYPELQSCLLAAIEQRPAAPDAKLGFLQVSVIRQALDHARTHDWPRLVSRRAFVVALLANACTFALFTAALIGMTLPVVAAARSAKQTKRVTPAGAKTTMTVEPGNVEIERGTSLLVLARIAGPMPPQALLVAQPEGGEPILQPMPASLNDPVFGGRIARVDGPLEYRVELDDGLKSPTYHVTVFEYPRLERTDAHLVFPTYTGQEPRTIEDVRTVSVVEGTQVTLRCRLNKPVRTATLTDAKSPDAAPLVLAPSAAEPLVYETTFVGQQSLKLQVDLVDEAGRKNVKAELITVNVLPNRPPTLKPTFPARDQEVSALEELDVRAEATDDFGVIRFGLTYALAGQPSVDVVVAEQIAGRQKHVASHLLNMEALHAEPDQLVSYHWWAEDFDSAGQVRRVESDMYFAEVRPFEEIFRQGEQPPGGSQQQQRQQGQPGSQNERDAQQLAQLQKDIINATWKLIRREPRDPPSAPFAPDVEQVRSSQASALEQAEGLGDRVEDEQSRAHVRAVVEQMQAAANQLQAAHDGPTIVPLKAALAAEQQAYQSLLRLRAREHEVVRQRQQQQQQSSSSSSSSRSQQQREQMEQLDLREEQNRYETQRTAEELQAESAAERENRQVLNRLKELARRQHDLNERLKELQSALEAAATPREQEELRRQLQRLQDEQRQILQDTDELQSRLDQPENQERMQEERQQLQETRDQVRRASEALEDDKVTQAAASGTRAEQQFDELREEFRRRASARFSEEMQDLRDAARELDDKEQEIGRRLRGEPEESGAEGRENAEQGTEPAATPPKQKPKPVPTLSDDPAEGDVANDLREQRQRLTDLQDKMRDTIERAEATEPILSQRLYDTVRNLRDQNIERSLETAEQLQRRGFTKEAAQQEAPAAEGIEKLRQDVERAAEGVLGDGTEALRRARAQLRNLQDELNNELERNAPELAERTDRNGEPGEENAAGEPTDGQPGEAREPGEERPGAGEPREGERDPMSRGGRRTSPPNGEPNEEGEALRPGQRGERQPGEEGAEGEQPGERPDGEESEAGEPGRNPQGRNPRGQYPRGQSQRNPSGQNRPGEGERVQNEPGQDPEGEQPGENPMGENPGQNPGQQPGQSEQGQQGQRGQNQRGSRGERTPGDPRGGAFTEGGGNLEDFTPRNSAPLTGENFREWSDRLRDVEEMVDDPDLRAEAARIRDRARSIRAESKRHSAAPNWELVRDQVSQPLVELEKRVAEELLRRTSKKALVPLDRDPVPPQFSEKTRRYYERLGSGK